MKRLATLAGLALASLIGAFAFTVPAHATAVTCTSPTTSGTNTYPMNYLWICNGNGTVTTGDVNAANGALGHLGGVAVGVDSDAKHSNRMANNNHYVYVFAKIDDFNGANKYCTVAGNKTSSPPVPPCPPASGAGSIPASAVGWTYTMDSGTTWQSVIFEDRLNAQSPVVYTNMGSTVAHEAGHQLDSIYGVLLNGSGFISTPGNTPATTNEFAFKLTGMKATFTGSVFTAGDTLTLSFKGQLLGSTVTITHNVVGGDTLTSIASDFASQINSNGSLTAMAINAHATSVAGVLSVTSNAALEYSDSTTGTGGHAATETITQSLYDFPAFDTLIACDSNSGIFSAQQDHAGAYICSSRANGTVGGTVTVNDLVGVTVTDTALPGGSKSVAYQVVTGDTTAKIAAGLAAKITADTDMINAGISAINVGSVVRISSGTGNATTYAPSLSMGATETLTGLTTTPTPGAGDTLAHSYSTNKYNSAVLMQAWPHYWTNVDFPLWTELFAEETAIIASQTGPGNNQTPIHYEGSGKFICTKNFVNALEKNGAVPGPTNFPYSTDCK